MKNDNNCIFLGYEFRTRLVVAPDKKLVALATFFIAIMKLTFQIIVILH